MPLYCWIPPGQLFVNRDRILGPEVDLAFAMEAKKGNSLMGPLISYVEERLFKPGVAAFIANGGAHTTAQFALAPLHTLTFPIC